MKTSPGKKLKRKELEAKLSEAISTTLAAYDETAAESSAKRIKKASRSIAEKFRKSMKSSRKKSKSKPKTTESAVTIKVNGSLQAQEEQLKLTKEYHS